jgi:CBS domain-containing membrane protein
MAWHIFAPILAGATLRDRVVACLGAAVAIALTIVVCANLPIAAVDVPIIVAPLGASAVLVFAVPSSPMAQPWPVVGGNTISTLVGVAAYNLMPNPTIAAGIAVGGAILVMSLLRCLHPPGGAAALTVVIGSHGIHAAGYSFAFAPVGINSVALVSIAMLFYRATAHSYPHRPTPSKHGRFEHSDIDAALGDMHESFDISREDLDALLEHAERHAAARATQKPAA